MAARRVRVVRKNGYTCIDGPFKDVTLYLASGSTLEFSYNGQRGRYLVHSGYSSTLKWESRNEDGTRSDP